LKVYKHTTHIIQLIFADEEVFNIKDD